MSRKTPIDKIIDYGMEMAANEISGFHDMRATHVHSPIEHIFLTAFYVVMRNAEPRLNVHVCMVEEDFWFSSEHASWKIMPQAPIGPFRCDFAIRWLNMMGDWSPRLLIVECDGHDFHERTKEQASKDRARDRELQQMGHTVFRFTGADLYRDPVGCATQAANWLIKQFFDVPL